MLACPAALHHLFVVPGGNNIPAAGMLAKSEPWPSVWQMEHPDPLSKIVSPHASWYPHSTSCSPEHPFGSMYNSYWSLCRHQVMTGAGSCAAPQGGRPMLGQARLGTGKALQARLGTITDGGWMCEGTGVGSWVMKWGGRITSAKG
jgi:hypothetical protein